ncbi:LytTR family transcriptional regulator DNA-binding domain-containing protein [Chryseobacterium sp. MMS23-Vi53]|uniref:LytTR family transcriptional regulator DNA-binding domain-containing protein n=1 Tax=Chryseobacterium sp. MMS23-Vi53 TaxID=3386644 RepID=UPI0039ECD455
MNKIHVLIIVCIIIVLAGISYLGFNFTYQSSSNELMEQQLKVAQYQSELVANMISDELESGKSKDEVKNGLQQALEKSSTEPVFLCMFDKNGREVCHPDRKKIGSVIPNENDYIKSFSNMDLELNFKDVLSKSVDYGGVRKVGNITEIIYLSPVRNTDWIMASHSNLESLEQTLDNIKTKLMLFFILTWVCSVALILFLINLLYQRYFNKIAQENIDIQNHVIEKYEEEIIQEKEPNRLVKRFLAEKGLKLIPVEVESIAFIYLEDKITYVVDMNGGKSTLNLSLDEVYQNLDKEQFFRVSRQIILSLKSIKNIEKYGVTQLKAVTNPISEVPIIVSKARVSEFKLWIGK